MKKKTLCQLSCLLMTILLMTSCKSLRTDYLYFADMNPNLEYPVVQKYETVIKQDDKLSITVTCKNPDLAMAFNINGTAGYSVGADGTVTANNVNSGSNNRPGYIVNADGDIEFPILGKLHVEGMTRRQVELMIKNKLIEQGLLNNPLVIVELLNFKITVLGRIGHVGTIDVETERFTLIDAIAKCGDLDEHSRLDRIGVIREIGNSRRIYWNDIRSSDIFLSPTFYLQQNDIIYIEPDSYDAENRFMNKYRYWTLALSTLTTILWTLIYIDRL